MTETILMHTALLKDPVLYEMGMHCVGRKRREKLLSLKNGEAARLSLGAGILLTAALEQYGLVSKSEEIGLDQMGKPFLPCSDFFFNLSHSGEYALCAFGDMPVGADLQQRREALPKRTKKILSEAERLWLEGLGEAERTKRFYELWAKKESILKLDGRGIRYPMAELSLEKKTGELETILFEGKKLFLKSYPLEGYAVSVCSENEAFSPVMREFTKEDMNKILNKY